MTISLLGLAGLGELKLSGNGGLDISKGLEVVSGIRVVGRVD